MISLDVGLAEVIKNPQEGQKQACLGSSQYLNFLATVNGG